MYLQNNRGKPRTPRSYTTRYRFNSVDYSADPVLVGRDKLAYLENGYIDDNGVVRLRTGTRKRMDMPIYDDIIKNWGDTALMEKPINDLIYMQYYDGSEQKEAWLLWTDARMVEYYYDEEEEQHSSVISDNHGSMLVKCSEGFAEVKYAGGKTGNEIGEPYIIWHESGVMKPKHFLFENKLFMLTGLAYLIYDGEKILVAQGRDYLKYEVDDTLYVPTTTVVATPAGAGTANEAVNNLTTRRRNSFVGDGVAKTFQLDAKNLGSGTVTAIVDGSTITEGAGLTVDRTNGTVTFGTTPSDATGKADNVIITFNANNNTYSGQDIYYSNQFTTIPYGNGIYFIFANGNKIWRSALNDPTYFPDDNYAILGDGSPITGFGQIGEYAAAFKENGEIYLLSLIEVGNEVELSVYRGVKTETALSCFEEADNDTLYLTRQGVYALTSSNVLSQTVTRNRSAFIDKLLKAEDMTGAVSCLWKNYYLVAIKDHMYVFDITNKNYTNRDNADFAYTAYYWTFPFEITCLANIKDELYAGTSDGMVIKFNSDIPSVEQYNDLGERIKFMLATCADDDGNYMLQKTMLRNGSGLLVTPDSQSALKVYLNKDLETSILAAEFDTFDLNYVNLNDFPLSTIDASRPVPFLHKEKKYRTLQFLIENVNKDESIALLGITKRFVTSNYIKR